MNYKETLFFTARSLTINHEKHNYQYVKESIEDHKVNWDQVVKLSTEHYILPALFCNLKRASLLDRIPRDLVAFMEHITQLNRMRNEGILKQAKELNSLLKEHQIEPLYLKGTGFLLQNLYHDIGERMLGDIDCLLSKGCFTKTTIILEKFGYQKFYNHNYAYPQFKHYDRLVKEGSIAALEIHKELTKEGFHQNFNFERVSKNTIFIDENQVMSLENQLCLSLVADLVNDDGQFYDNISLRNAYDVYLLSQKVNTLTSIEGLTDIFTPMNNFLAICQITFNSKAFQFSKTKKSTRTIKHFLKIIDNADYRKSHFKKIKWKLFWRSRMRFVLKGITRKENRVWMYNRFRDRNWQRQKLVQLKILKPKS